TIISRFYDMSEEPEIVRILHALARSKVRMRVLNFLADHSGEHFSAGEIARALGISSGNVHGSLDGSTGKFQAEYSLVGMGLVLRSEPGPMQNPVTFTVTALGFNASAANRYRTEQ
ncbi:MAG: archaellum operon transcriptional activator EarA family protein, partial [Methanocella sp.]